MSDILTNRKKLILTIVDKGLGSRVVEATKLSGCHGGTIIPGIGTHKEQTSFWGLEFDPEKDLIFSLIEEELAEKVFETIVKEAGLDEPGKGVAFIVNVPEIAGVAHLINPES
jgi:nitrogen regulatory protein P-II 1